MIDSKHISHVVDCGRAGPGETGRSLPHRLTLHFVSGTYGSPVAAEYFRAADAAMDEDFHAAARCKFLRQSSLSFSNSSLEIYGQQWRWWLMSGDLVCLFVGHDAGQAYVLQIL